MSIFTRKEMVVVLERTSNLAESDLDYIWKEYAPAYSKVLPKISFYSDSVNRIVESVEGYYRILDSGCGPGIITERLAEKGHEVVGIDNDKTMLEYAEKRLAAFPNVRLEQQDTYSLAFDSETFDGVISHNVLYFIEDPTKVLKEIYRILKFNGILVLVGPKPNPDFGLLFRKIIEDLEYKGLLTEFSRDLDVIRYCNKIIEEKGMKNTYTNAQLRNILIENIGFSRILESGECYFSQSYFLVANKKGGAYNGSFE